jgi:Flp pilus assembly protein TadD
MNDPVFQQALALQRAGRLTEAIALYRQLLRKRESADDYANLGVALRSQGQVNAAVGAYRRALALSPRHVFALSNLGGALRALGQLSEARLCLLEAISLAPDFAAAHYNLGLAYMDSQQPEAAIACFEKAMTLEPGRVDAPFDRAVCLLQTGNLQAGFAAYESRFAYEPRLVRDYPQLLWDGSPLGNRTLLVYTEQGFGDALQFIRYVPLIAKGDGRIILECPAPLQRLFQDSRPEIDAFLKPGEPLPPFDAHVSLVSLPHLFQSRLETIPREVPYLQSPDSVRRRLPPASPGAFKVGIAWASGHADVGARNRRIDVNHFARLLEIPSVRLYSLQKGDAEADLVRGGLEALIEDVGSRMADFADTASVLEDLDLVISADTALIHLAGALRKPVWVALPYGSEWRWLLHRDDSPWYPGMRLFRQSRPGNWDGVFERLRTALRQAIQGKKMFAY